MVNEDTDESTFPTPKYVFYICKGVITVLTVVALAMLVNNVHMYKEKIRSGLLMVSLYITMFVCLVVSLVECWLDS